MYYSFRMLLVRIISYLVLNIFKKNMVMIMSCSSLLSVTTWAGSGNIWAVWQVWWWQEHWRMWPGYLITWTQLWWTCVSCHHVTTPSPVRDSLDSGQLTLQQGMCSHYMVLYPVMLLLKTELDDIIIITIDEEDWIKTHHSIHQLCIIKFTQWWPIFNFKSFCIVKIV